MRSELRYVRSPADGSTPLLLEMRFERQQLRFMPRERQQPPTRAIPYDVDGLFPNAASLSLDSQAGTLKCGLNLNVAGRVDTAGLVGKTVTFTDPTWRKTRIWQEIQINEGNGQLCLLLKSRSRREHNCSNLRISIEQVKMVALE